jgi:hypothetical protein
MAGEPVLAWHNLLSAQAQGSVRYHRTGLTGAATALLAGLLNLVAVTAVQAHINAARERKNLQLIDAYIATEWTLTATQAEKQKTEGGACAAGGSAAASRGGAGFSQGGHAGNRPA